MANAETELYTVLATTAPRIYLSLAIANKELYILEPYPWFLSAPKKYLAWSRLACMLRSRCMPPWPRSAPSSKLFTRYVPVSPVSRAERCKPCPVALVPTLGCSRPLPPSLLLLASALSGNIIPRYIFLLNYKRSLHSGRSRCPARKKNHRVNHAYRRFRSCLGERPSAAGERRPVYPYLQLCPRTHVEIRG